MKQKQQEELFNSFTSRMISIIKSKSYDYCNVENDVLENFKTAGANAGISTQQQLLSLIATKVARLGNLFKGKTPNNESIDDSVIDLANYVFLLHCSLNDNPNVLHIKGSESGSYNNGLPSNITRSNNHPEKGWPIYGPIKDGRNSF